MANEQLIQQGYLTSNGLHGEKEGKFEVFKLGDTSIRALKACGIRIEGQTKISFPLTRFKMPDLLRLKPDKLYCLREAGTIRVIGICESKTPKKFKTEPDKTYAHEQALCAAVILGAKVAVATDGNSYEYVNIESSLAIGKIVLLDEERHLNPGVLEELFSATPGVSRDPTELAEKVWQSIWHATKAEPKECLLTFVEIFGKYILGSPKA